MSATSPAGSENLPRGPVQVGMGEKIVRFFLNTAVYGIFGTFALLLLGSLFFPAIQGGGGSPRLECLNNLRQIGLALHNYHQEHGSFPPAYIADAHGKPLYSWRVLLLPYIERNSVYEDFHRDEPWDSPHNLQLIDKMPRVYRCQKNVPAGSYFTNAVVVTGPGTVFDGTKICRLTDITDGPDKTLLVTESAESGIVWTEPRDLPLATLNLKINADRKGISCSHGIHGSPPSIWNLWSTPQPVSNGANVIFCDGHGRFLPNTIPPETLRALCTINGGERLSDDNF